MQEAAFQRWAEDGEIIIPGDIFGERVEVVEEDRGGERAGVNTRGGSGGCSGEAVSFSGNQGEIGRFSSVGFDGEAGAEFVGDLSDGTFQLPWQVVGKLIF